MNKERKRLEIEAQRIITSQLIKLEKANTEALKAKIDDFVNKARAWIKEEVREALHNELRSSESIKKGA